MQVVRTEKEGEMMGIRDDARRVLWSSRSGFISINCKVFIYKIKNSLLTSLSTVLVYLLPSPSPLNNLRPILTSNCGGHLLLVLRFLVIAYVSPSQLSGLHTASSFTWYWHSEGSSSATCSPTAGTKLLLYLPIPLG